MGEIGISKSKSRFPNRTQPMLLVIYVSYKCLLHWSEGNSLEQTEAFLTHSLLEILPKNGFEASRVGFWSLSCYKELKLTTNRFTGCTLRGLLI